MTRTFRLAAALCLVALAIGQACKKNDPSPQPRPVTEVVTGVRTAGGAPVNATQHAGAPPPPAAGGPTSTVTPPSGTPSSGIENAYGLRGSVPFDRVFVTAGGLTVGGASQAVDGFFELTLPAPTIETTVLVRFAGGGVTSFNTEFQVATGGLVGPKAVVPTAVSATTSTSTSSTTTSSSSTTSTVGSTTTSTAGSTSTTTSGSTSTTTTVPGTTTTSTSTVGSSTTSSTTTSTSTTTTAGAQSTLVFTFTPNPVPTSGLQTTCNGGPTPAKTWSYQLRIQNTSSVPFTIQQWMLSSPGNFSNQDVTSQFQSAFGTTTIGANATVQTAPNGLCVFLNSAASGSVFHTFLGTGGNGPFNTPALELQAEELWLLRLSRPR